jgi:hypothetical protein
MSPFVVVLGFGILACQNPPPSRTDTPATDAQRTPVPDTQPTPATGAQQAPAPGAQRTAVPPAQLAQTDTTVLRALAVLDSLIPLRAPSSLSSADQRTWSEQTEWLKTLKGRIETLLSLVVTPAQSVAVPAPVERKNIKALQEEAEQESAKLVLSSAPLRARHDAAMTAIRAMKEKS